MSRGVNTVHLVGNIGKDPELRATRQGTPKLEISLATEDRQGHTQWHDLVFWKSSAEIAARNLRKGARLHVTGTIRYSLFKDSKDVHHKRAYVHVQEFVFLDSGGARA